MKRIIILMLVLQFNVGLLSSQVVQYWLTEGNQNSLIAEQPSINFSSALDGANATITIDANQAFQSIDAFGFMLTQGSAEVINGLDPAVKGNLLQELFGSNGLDISGVRISIGASDLSNSVYTYNEVAGDENMDNFSLAGPDLDHVIPLLKEIIEINPEIKILATPWTAPTWMKDNNSYIGGSLETQYYNAFATYFVKYIQAMQAEGLDIWAITPQNEPENPWNEPSMLMTSNEQIAFINNHLGPQFSQHNINAKIIVFDHNCDNPNYPISVLNATPSYSDGAAFHLYEGDISTMSTVKNSTGKNVYFTEQYTDIRGDFSDDLSWHMQRVVIGSINNWSKTVFEWNLATDSNYGPRTPGGCEYCLGAVTIQSSTTYDRNVSYYIIGQVSKFVKAGAKRLLTTSNRDYLPAVALENPDGSIALVVHNSRRNSQSIKVDLGGVGFNATVPKGSAATFLWTPDNTGTIINAPSSLAVAAISQNDIQLSWNDNSNNEDGFSVQRSLSQTTGWSTVASVAANTTQFIDTGLTAGTTYYYRVRATLGSEFSSWSNIENATTDQDPNTGNDLLNILARHSGKGLDVQDVSTTNSANVQQWEINGTGQNQMWKLIPNSDGSFGIQVEHSGKCLSILRANRTNVVQKNCGSSIASWTLQDLGNGFFNIINLSNGLSLTVENGEVFNGANVTTASYSGADFQQWLLEDALIFTGSTPARGNDFSQSIEEKLEVRISPIIVQETLNVSTSINDSSSDVDIYNATGIRMFSKSNQHGSMFQVPVSTFPVGTYFLVVKSGNNSQVKRFIKM